MAKFKLTPYQVTAVNEAISLLDAFGTQHSQEAVFSEYSFYRRQDEAGPKAEALDALITTFKDIRHQLGKVPAEADLPEMAKQAKLLEGQVDFILANMKLHQQRHAVNAAVRKVGRIIVGGRKG